MTFTFKGTVSTCTISYFPLPNFGNEEYSVSGNQNSLWKILLYGLLIRGLSLLPWCVCIHIYICKINKIFHLAPICSPPMERMSWRTPLSVPLHVPHVLAGHKEINGLCTYTTHTCFTKKDVQMGALNCMWQMSKIYINLGMHLGILGLTC